MPPSKPPPRVNKGGKKKTKSPSKRQQPTRRPRARAGATPSEPRLRATAPRGGRVTAMEKRILELERIGKEKRELEKRERELAAQIPVAPMVKMPRDPGMIERRRGREYATYFKAQGTMGGTFRYPGMRDLMDEDEEEMGVEYPAAFYSTERLRQAKWKGIVDRETIIREMNAALVYGGKTRGFDFRDVYSKWKYTYQVVEFLGGVPIKIWRERKSNTRTARQNE